MFDYRQLVNRLVNNNQFRLPPMDVIRMGTIVGYDPNFQDGEDGNNFPTVNVTLGGDAAPFHGIRFAETYVPNIGDTVMCVQTGEDIYVLHAFAGADKDTIRNVRSAPGLLGHSTTIVPSTSTGAINGAQLTTSILPNRLYRVEVTADFYAPKSGTSGTAVVTVQAPNGEMLDIGRASIKQNANTTFSGSALWCDTGDDTIPLQLGTKPATPLAKWVEQYPQGTKRGSKGGQNPQGTWVVLMQPEQFADAGVWSESGTYKAGQVVSEGKGRSLGYYIAQHNIGPFDPDTVYLQGDVVTYKGSMYTSKHGSYYKRFVLSNVAPDDASGGLGTWRKYSGSTSPAIDATTAGGRKFWKQDPPPSYSLKTHSLSILDLGVFAPQSFTEQS